MTKFFKETADGLVLYSAYEVVKMALDIISQPSAWSSPASFIAGATAVATLLFVDYYISETV